MPTYLYVDEEKDQEVSLVLTCSKKESLEIDSNGTIVYEGTTLKRNLMKELGGFNHYAGAWPLHSVAAGVGPDQVQEATEHAKAIGVPTEFDKQTGDAIFIDKRHRKRYCEKRGLYDKNGGYGDPQRK